MRRFAQRKLDVLPRIQRRKQRALLEQNASIAGLRVTRGRELDLPAPFRQQPDQRAHQDRLAAAGRTDQPDDFTCAHVEGQVIDDVALPKADHEVGHADSDGLVRHGYIPIEAKKMANRPSSTITRKIDFTTDVVVCLPSDSALPATRSPSLQATMPITIAMNGALRMPTLKVVSDTASRSRSR